MRDKVRKLIRIDFVRFGIVGAIGFLINAFFLRVLHGSFELAIIPATLISSEAGLLSNFVFHEKWTYKHLNHQSKSVWRKLLHFHMSSWTGIVIITVIETVCVKAFNIDYLISLVIASGIAMFWNFFWTRYFIFNGSTPGVLMSPEDTVPEREA